MTKFDMAEIQTNKCYHYFSTLRWIQALREDRGTSTLYMQLKGNSNLLVQNPLDKVYSLLGLLALYRTIWAQYKPTMPSLYITYMPRSWISFCAKRRISISSSPTPYTLEPEAAVAHLDEDQFDMLDTTYRAPSTSSWDSSSCSSDAFEYDTLMDLDEVADLEKAAQKEPDPRMIPGPEGICDILLVMADSVMMSYDQRWRDAWAFAERGEHLLFTEHGSIGLTNCDDVPPEADILAVRACYEYLVILRKISRLADTGSHGVSQRQFEFEDEESEELVLMGSFQIFGFIRAVTSSMIRPIARDVITRSFL
ncbi:hypothetical protein Micbo1qcDRAFT_179706 [Microdochium bolleyi]|uniref:Uncharacterized protein n=1 Tax=Microdochium bolleyi TaxID=196109 RepID=A0A136IP75_9PEZI|nr:hypothetical protein Micbo1qcDRAFT_179706 [Microdochium bolleyi]